MTDRCRSVSRHIRCGASLPQLAWVHAELGSDYFV